MWKISIDTGGTFTDCIAVNPEGNTERLKVLSSGVIKGKLIAKENGWYKSGLSFSFSRSIFQNYTIRLGSIVESFIVKDFNPVDNSFLIDCDKNIEFPIFFILTANEEAPLLATRILTETVLNESFPEIELRLGTTKGTNALLEKKGEKTILIVTKGFKDLLFIGTQQRPHLFQLNIPDSELLFHEVIEVDERINSEGIIINELNENILDKIIKEKIKGKYTTVAIALLNSYKNATHENVIQNKLEKNGIKFISASSHLHPFIHLLPRARTTVVNAYLKPTLNQYFNQIKKYIPNLKIMSSAGGLMNADIFQPKDGLLSGPAGGVLGAAHVAQQFNVDKILTLDMGGTSTDCARYNDRFDYSYTTKIGAQQIAVPTVDIETVAAGGGSICSFDGYKLTVGPESAGANPGPACYGSGGEFTITDVNLLLGKITPIAFSIPINKEASEKKLQEIKECIKLKTGKEYSSLDILKGFEKIADEKMAAAIKKISVSKGFDPKEYTLMAFGGAGGMHICSIANLLDIDKIIIPYDAGVLSAKGIHHAEIEKWLSIQILENYDDCKNEIVEKINLLINNLFLGFKKEGIDGNKLIIKNKFIYLRLLGQSNSIELEYSDNLISNFEIKYKKLFGHYPKNRKIEIERIKIIMSTNTFNPRKIKKLNPNENIIIKNDDRIYNWDDLFPNQTIQGKSILYNKLGTVHIPENWTLTLQENKDAILIREQKINTTEIENEAIALELFTNRFMAIAEKTGLQLQRTSFSVNIKERLDFSCAILDPQAELLANAPHIPVHLGSLGICARLILKEFPLKKGDVIITNHPKYGGSHLPDVTLLSAAFDDKDELVGYLINRAHHAEIGGKRPGSMPPDAINLTEEGVVIHPTYLAKEGILQWDTIERLLKEAPYPTRAISENIADINAALASLKSGEEDLKELVRKHGLEKVHFYMEKLKDSSTQTLEESLIPFMNKELSAVEYLDDGHKIAVQISINEKGIHFDFEGTSSVHPKNLNANPAIVNSVVIYVLRLICNDDRIPLNEGLMKHITIKLPKNSFLSPIFPNDDTQCPAVVGGNTEVSQRLTDTLLKAFGMAACSQGTMNNFLFGNERFGYYETIGGGTGAGNGFDGRSAVHQHMTNTKITDPEEMEFRYPVRLWNFGIRKNSGGEGKFKGGDGIIREVEFLEEMDITILSQHRENMPYGLNGGKEGKSGRQTIIRANGEIESLKHIDKTKVKAGDKIIIETPGGGGFGEKD